MKYFFKFCFDSRVGTGGDCISGIVDGIAKGCRCHLTDAYENVYKLLQFRCRFRAQYEGDCIGEFLNLSLHDLLLCGILLDCRFEFYVGHFGRKLVDILRKRTI